jgi:hypothetical protein
MRIPALAILTTAAVLTATPALERGRQPRRPQRVGQLLKSGRFKVRTGLCRHCAYMPPSRHYLPSR